MMELIAWDFFFVFSCISGAEFATAWRIDLSQPSSTQACAQYYVTCSLIYMINMPL